MSTFNLKLTSQQSPCNDKDYYFKAFVEDNFTKVGQSVQTFVTGGVGPFTWTADGDGTFAEETTAGKINTLTCDTMPSDSMLTFTVEDSCGNVVEGAISVWSYNPGEGCSATYVPFAVVGTEEPVVGTVYTAEGGQAPYTYSFDKGTIDPVTGEILTIDDCGDAGTSRVGIVSATDAFGAVTEIEVRLPGGQWVQVGWEKGSLIGVVYSECVSDSNWQCHGISSKSCEETDGDYLKEAVLTSDDFGPCPNAPYPCYDLYTYNCAAVNEWQCP